MAIEIRGMTPLIQVFNMRRALAFYRDILGFELVSDSGNGDDSSWVWLRLNNSERTRMDTGSASNAHRNSNSRVLVFAIV